MPAAGGGSRPPRRPDGSKGRPEASRPKTRSSGQRGGGGARPTGARGRSGAVSTGRRRGDRRPPTAAEKRAAEVNAARARRPPRDPNAEREKIEGRTLDTWIDEGALRDEAAGAASRAKAPARPARRRRHVAAETSAQITARARDARRASTLTDRLGQAQEALDGERFDDARRIASSIVREVRDVAAVHEVIGLAAYRTGRWKQAAAELEVAQALDPSPELLPVLADAYRALRRWADVERIWADVRAASPSQEVLAEARIVAAGAQVDQGDLQGALLTMGKATRVPKRVRDHHLRQWYVLADLHDRAGDTLEATRWFELVAAHDRDFVDVIDRLRALGR